MPPEQSGVPRSTGEQASDYKEYTFECVECGAIYNTHHPDYQPSDCYECGTQHPWERKQADGDGGESDTTPTQAELGEIAAETQNDAATDTDTTGGQLHDSYHAALQNDIDTPGDSDRVLGVVNEQMYGIQNHIDENWPALAPPDPLFNQFKQTADEMGHNAAVSEVDFRARYRDHLQGETPQARIAEIRTMLAEGTDVWIVCYENTDDKFCHRDILKRAILEVDHVG